MSRTTTASDVVMRGLRALSVAAVVAVLVAAFVWLAVMLGLGVLFIAGVSGPRSVESFAPLVLLVLGVAMLVLLVRAEWWSRGWRKIVVVVVALVTVGYGGLVVEAAPVLYGVGAAQNAWTLSEMVRFDLARIEELDVGACFDIRYRARGAPPSHLVRPVDCSRPHSAEVVGIDPTNVSAHQDAAALERLAEQACDRAAGLTPGAWESSGGEVWLVAGPESSPALRTVICAMVDRNKL